MSNRHIAHSTNIVSTTDAVRVRAGHTLAILDSSYRVVLKSGAISGARACATSMRAAARGLQSRRIA